ncbi:MAG: methyltransferase family protein [Candidatus Heimdallarchaeota archaeon]
MSSVINLWIFYVAGYAIAYSLQIWANRKRGEPFDDPEFLFQGKNIIVPALLWLIGGFIISLFVPVNFGFLFYLGLFFAIVGLLIGGLAMYSFAHERGLTTTKIHRYSRNPVYVGWTFFIGGLSLIGWSESVWSIIFLIYFIITLPYFHWTVLLEEAFLATKYGDSYQEYRKITPRYLGIPKKLPSQ